MAPLEISISASSTTTHPAQLATLTLKTSTTKPFPTAQEADSQVATTINSLLDAISPYCPERPVPSDTKAPPAIASYAIASFESTSTKLHSGAGGFSSMSKVRYEDAYVAHAELRIVFRDFKLLARIATQVSSLENVSVKALAWSLEPQTQAASEAAARKGAARNALQKACDYAEVFAGVSAEDAARKVCAKEVKETGPYAKDHSARLHFGKEQGVQTQKGEWEYEPRDVSIGVEIAGKFVVDV